MAIHYDKVAGYTVDELPFRHFRTYKAAELAVSNYYDRPTKKVTFTVYGDTAEKISKLAEAQGLSVGDWANRTFEQILQEASHRGV